MASRPAVADDSVWRHHPDLAVVDSPGRVALVSLDRLDEPPVLLTDTGAAVWELLDGRRTVGEVVGLLAAEVGLEPAEIRADVAGFVQQLAERALVAPVRPGPAAARSSSP
jgi:hypothetical protein